jgi:ElaB/YqjD/DUF883 family membrane-anchored ribosome-binding protein
MAYDTMERTTGAAAARSQQVMDVAQDAAERAGAYVQRQIGHMSDRARDMTRVLGESLESYTGRPAGVLVSDVREYIRAHPLQMLGAMVGVGYILGKLMTRD